jgi:hypothetical protein
VNFLPKIIEKLSKHSDWSALNVRRGIFDLFYPPAAGRSLKKYPCWNADWSVAEFGRAMTIRPFAAASDLRI